MNDTPKMVHRSTPQEIVHVDEVLKLLTAISGDQRYEDILREKGSKEVKSMCDVAERLEQKGRQEGRQGLFHSLLEGGVISIEEAMEYGYKPDPDSNTLIGENDTIHISTS